MKSKNARFKKPPARRALLDVDKREQMIAVLIRNESAHRAVRDRLTPETLAAVDPGHAALWRIVCGFYDEYGRLPTKRVLLAELRDTLGATPGLLTTEEVEEVEALVKGAYRAAEDGENPATSDTQAEWAIKAAQRFLEDQLALKVQEAVHAGGTRPADLPALLQSVTDEANVLGGLSAHRADVPFPEGWDRASPVPLFPTGIAVLDRFLGGGHRGGEVYLFMGPFGSCKTTVAVMGLVEGARYAASLTARPDWDRRTPLCVIVSYETPVEELRERCLSYAASIPRPTIAQAINGAHGMGHFSTADELRDYERVLFRAKIQAGEPVPGERERAEEAIDLLNRHALFLDMTGSDPRRREAGNGYVPEIARALDQELRHRRKTYPLVVWVDYLGALAKRHLAASEHDYGDLRHLISGGILQLGAQVARPLRCPVWVSHQLSGEANGRTPAARMHHTDGAEAKNVAENADFAIVTGNPTSDTQLCVFACTKHRREPPRRRTVVRVEGEFNRIVDVGDEYAVDPYAREILPMDEVAGRYGSPDEIPFDQQETKSPFGASNSIRW